MEGNYVLWLKARKNMHIENMNDFLYREIKQGGRILLFEMLQLK